jgi:hypothetical protein
MPHVTADAEALWDSHAWAGGDAVTGVEFDLAIGARIGHLASASESHYLSANRGSPTRGRLVRIRPKARFQTEWVGWNLVDVVPEPYPGALGTITSLSRRLRPWVVQIRDLHHTVHRL